MAGFPDYSHYKKIAVRGATGADPDYQVLVRVFSGAGTDIAQSGFTPAEVYLGDGCVDFPNDIRFTDGDGSTELDQHLLLHYSYGVNGQSWALYKIEVTDDLGSNQDIYVYWGASTSLSSDDSATHLVGADFNDGATTGLDTAVNSNGTVEVPTLTKLHDLLNVDYMQKCIDNPVIAVGGGGTWNESGIRDLGLLLDANNRLRVESGNIIAYAFGTSSGGAKSIGRYTSSDGGRSWVEYGGNPVLEATGAGWEQSGVSACAVMYLPGAGPDTNKPYKMLYQGWDTTGSPDHCSIGLAESADGLSWTRYGSNPVISYSLFTNRDTIGVPWMIKIGSTYVLVGEGYNYTTTDFYIYGATSANLTSWTAMDSGDAILAWGTGDSWEDEGQANPKIIEAESGKYILAYNGNDGTNWRVGFATATDAPADWDTSSWTPHTNNPLIVPGPTGRWDALHTECSAMVVDDLEQGSSFMRFWYNGFESGEPVQIGLAFAPQTRLLHIYSGDGDADDAGFAGINITDDVTLTSGFLYEMLMFQDYKEPTALAQADIGLHDATAVSVDTLANLIARRRFYMLPYSKDFATGPYKFIIGYKNAADANLYWTGEGWGTATYLGGEGLVLVRLWDDGTNYCMQVLDPFTFTHERDEYDGETPGANPANWTVSEPAGTAIEISTTQSRSSPNSIKLYDTSTPNACSISRNFTECVQGKYFVSAYPCQTNQYLSVLLRDPGETIGPYIDFLNDGNISYYDGSWNPIVAYSANTWYDIEIEWDCDHDQFEIVINGVRKGPYPFNTSLSSIESIFHGTTTTAGTRTFYIDNTAWTTHHSVSGLTAYIAKATVKAFADDRILLFGEGATDAYYMGLLFDNVILDQHIAPEPSVGMATEYGVCITAPVATADAEGLVSVIVTESVIAAPLASTADAVGLAPTVHVSIDVSAPVATIDVAGLAPSILEGGGVEIAVPVGTVAAVGLMPAISGSVLISAPTATVTAQAYAPSIPNVGISIPLAIADVQGHAPTIDLTIDVEVEVPLVTWASPTDHNDPDSQWIRETNAYDDNTATTAEGPGNVGWGPFLELTIAATSSNKIKYFAYKSPGIDSIDVDVYYSSAWHDVYQGDYTGSTWEEKGFTATSVTKARVRFYNNTGVNPEAICDFDFCVVPIFAEAFAPSISTGSIISAPLATADVAGLTPSLTIGTGVTVTATLGTADVVGVVPTIAASVVVSVPLATADCVGLAPTITLPDVTITASVATADVEGLVPVIVAEVSIAAPLATTIAAVGLAPSEIITFVDIAASLATVDVVGLTPSLTNYVDVSAPVATIDVVGYAPIILGGGDVNIAIPVATATVEGLAPTAGGFVEISVPVGTADVAGVVPSMEVGSTILAAVASATAQAYAVTFILGMAIAVPLATVAVRGLPPIEAGLFVELTVITARYRELEPITAKYRKVTAITQGG